MMKNEHKKDRESHESFLSDQLRVRSRAGSIANASTKQPLTGDGPPLTPTPHIQAHSDDYIPSTNTSYPDSGAGTTTYIFSPYPQNKWKKPGLALHLNELTPPFQTAVGPNLQQTTSSFIPDRTLASTSQQSYLDATRNSLTTHKPDQSSLLEAGTSPLYRDVPVITILREHDRVAQRRRREFVRSQQKPQAALANIRESLARNHDEKHTFIDFKVAFATVFASSLFSRILSLHSSSI